MVTLFFLVIFYLFFYAMLYFYWVGESVRSSLTDVSICLFEIALYKGDLWICSDILFVLVLDYDTRFLVSPQSHVVSVLSV